jgi:hypothetical protein
MDIAPETARISSPADLVQAVPYLLGFAPRESLVLVGLRAGLLVVTARLDLADVAGDEAVLARTVEAMVNAGVDSILAAAYTDAARSLAGGEAAGWWAPLADAVRTEAQLLGCEVLDVLLVAGGRWRSLWCHEPGCCVPDGRPLPTAPSAFATAATVAGMVALPDREALAAVLAPAGDAERAEVGEAIAEAENEVVRALLDGHGERHRRSVKRALFAAARSSHAPRWSPVSNAEVARFAVALTDREQRDAAWLAIEGSRLDGRPLWREIARRAPAPYDAAAAFLYGWAAWRSGDGASARIAAQRAIDSDADYTMADLLLAALSHGLDPRVVPRMRKRPA